MRNERGFALLEVLIAFVIAAMALSVLLKGGLDGLRSARVAGRYEEAVARARSHLAWLSSSLVPGGDTQGDDGSRYHWHLRVAPVASVVTEGGPMGGARPIGGTLYALSVTVAWQEDGGTRAVELNTERFGPMVAVGAGKSGP